MRYDEFIEKMERLNDRELELELDKSRLADQFIEEMEFQVGDYVTDGTRCYQVLNIEYDFADGYLFADTKVVEAEDGLLPEKWKEGLTFCGEDVVKLLSKVEDYGL